MTATVWWETILQGLRNNAALIVGILAGIAIILNVIQARKIKHLHLNLDRSRIAAEEAARAAALAHPGSIDPEAVIEVLRRGIPPTLDNVYSVMRRREAIRQAESEPEPAPAEAERVTSSS